MFLLETITSDIFHHLIVIIEQKIMTCCANVCMKQFTTGIFATFLPSVLLAFNCSALKTINSNNHMSLEKCLTDVIK